MTMLLLAMAGAGVGAPSRYLVDRFIQTRHASIFPWGTFTINVVGCFLLAVLIGMGADLPSNLLVLLGAGFCGGFTTFSTFGFEAVRMTQDDHSGPALLYVVGSIVVGMLVAVPGTWLGGALA